MKNEIKYSIIYIISVLLISWGFVVFLFSNSKTIELYPVIMLIPASIALIMNAFITKSFKMVFKPVTASIGLKALFFSILFPVLFILIAASLVWAIGLGKINELKIDDIFKVPSFATIIIGTLLLFGEEYGWRGFLLKNLSESKGKFFATVAVGIIWALWHFPLIYGLSNHYNLENPLLITFIQMTAVFVLSVPFAFSYYLSGNIIPPMLFHFIWNWYNPIVLGNSYQNKAGIIEGNMLIINGEGIVGVLVGMAFIIWFTIKNVNTFALKV